MKTQKYSVNRHLIETILAWVKAPKDYFDGISAQCSGGAIQYGAISDMDARAAR